MRGEPGKQSWKNNACKKENDMTHMGRLLLLKVHIVNDQFGKRPWTKAILLNVKTRPH